MVETIFKSINNLQCMRRTDVNQLLRAMQNYFAFFIFAPNKNKLDKFVELILDLHFIP